MLEEEEKENLPRKGEKSKAKKARSRKTGDVLAPPAISLGREEGAEVVGGAQHCPDKTKRGLSERKSKVPIRSSNEGVEERLVHAEDIEELVELFYAQEVRSHHANIIGSMGEEIRTGKGVLCLFGPSQVVRHVINWIGEASGKKAKEFTAIKWLKADFFYLLNVSKYRPKEATQTMYRLLEQEDTLETTVIFAVTSMRSSARMDKRVRSRIKGSQSFAEDLPLEAYLRIFGSVVERISSKPGAYSLDSGDLDQASSMLSSLLSLSYQLDRSFGGMKLAFYKLLYSLPEESPYDLLGPLHLIILLISTVRKVSPDRIHAQFLRETSSVPMFKKVEKSLLLRRFFELVDLGLVNTSDFSASRLELEQHISARPEIYLKALLENAKRKWTKHSRDQPQR